MSYSSEAVRKNRLKKAAFVRALKQRPCTDCGVEYPWYVMQFDHVIGDKALTLSHVTRKNISMERILAEIVKCEIVCANCHAARSYKRLVGRQPNG